jgi:hypothetical protein
MPELHGTKSLSENVIFSKKRSVNGCEGFA